MHLFLQTCVIVIRNTETKFPREKIEEIQRSYQKKKEKEVSCIFSSHILNLCIRTEI